MIDSERSLAEGHIETGITLATHAAEQQVGQAQYRQLEAASAAAGRIAAGAVTSLLPSHPHSAPLSPSLSEFSSQPYSAVALTLCNAFHPV